MLRSRVDGGAGKEFWVIGPYPPPLHGASRVASLVVELARGRGQAVTVLSTSVQGRAYHVRRALKHVRIAAQLLLHKRSVEVRLYQTGAGGLALYYQAGIAAVARLRGFSQTFHHHSYAYINEQSRAMSVLVRLAGPDTLHVVLCEGMAIGLREKYGELQIASFSNAHFLGAGSRSVPLAGPPFVIGHLSNLGEDKGIDLVLDVVNSLRADGLDVRLRVAGPASSAAVRAMLEDHVDSADGLDEWVGALEPAAVPEFMGGLDCFLFPSRYINEALPLVVLEALREGTPSVTTRVGCLGDLLDAAGWTASLSVLELASVVRRVLSEPGSREVATDLYSSQHSEYELDRFYEAVAG